MVAISGRIKNKSELSIVALQGCHTILLEMEHKEIQGMKEEINERGNPRLFSVIVSVIIGFRLLKINRL